MVYAERKKPTLINLPKLKKKFRKLQKKIKKYIKWRALQ